MMIAEKQWYAVYTRSKWEKKVAALLERKNIETYCPLNKVVRQWSDRRKIVLEPLFTSYVFVHISALEQTVVKQIDGIINFVYWLGKPAIIKDGEIEVIKEFMNEYQNVRLERKQVNINDRVRIIQGPFTQIEGDVYKIKYKTVSVFLPSLGYQMVVEVEKSNIELIKEQRAIYINTN